MTDDAEFDRPQQVRHQVRHGGLGVDHRNVHIMGRRADAVRTDKIDFHFIIGAPEIAQNRHGGVHGETRRHLHAQGAQGRRAGMADFIQRIFEAVEGLSHDRQQVLARWRQSECMRLAVEKLDADESFQGNDMSG